MQCWQCGTEVQPGERTCGYCGARLTTPPAGRSPRSSQQRYPSSRNAPRRPRDDDWDADALDESGYGPGYAPDDASRYGPAYGSDDRGSERRGSRGRSDDSWDESRTDMRHGDQRSRPRGRQEPDERGGYPPAGYDQSGVYNDASGEYSAQQPNPMDDPLNDPRAPRSLRSSPQRGPDSRSRPPSRDDWQQQAPPDMGEGRSRRPPTDPSRARRDEGAYYGQRQGQGYPQAPYEGYEEPGRSRRSQPSSADNRYNRSSASRGQPYDEDYGGGYSDEYDAQRQRGSRQDYGRRMPPDDDSSWHQQVGSRARSMQQRWGETLSSVRIPGFRPAEGEDKGTSSSRRIVTTVVVLLVLLTAVVAGAIVLAPRVLNRLNPNPPGATTSSALCTASGPATNGTVPTPGAHLKQFASSRSRYGVNYPETWTVEPQQKAASGYDYIDVYTLPNSSTLVSIEQAQAACALSDVNIIQGEVAAAQQQNITFTESASSARTQTIGGEQWQRREYDVTDKGVTLHMVILACHHQGRAYVIVLVSRTTTFAQDDTGIFEPMLKSFAFTN